MIQLVLLPLMFSMFRRTRGPGENWREYLRLNKVLRQNVSGVFDFLLASFSYLIYFCFPCLLYWLSSPRKPAGTNGIFIDREDEFQLVNHPACDTTVSRLCLSAVATYPPT